MFYAIVQIESVDMQMQRLQPLEKISLQKQLVQVIFVALVLGVAQMGVAAEYKLFILGANGQSANPRDGNAVLGTMIQTSPLLKQVLVGDVLTFNVSHTIYRIVVKKRTQHNNGDVSLIGRTNGTQNLSIITRGKSGSVAIIHTKDGTYRIKQSGSGERLITPDDMSSIIFSPIDEGGVVPDRSDAEINAMQQIVQQPGRLAQMPRVGTATAIIDIMVFWDQAFEQAQGGESGARTKLNYLLVRANQAFSDSRIYIEINLVHSGKLDQAGDINNRETLKAMQVGMGVFKVVPALRDRYQADLVGFLRQYRYPEHGSCGIAFRLGARGVMPHSDRERAFFIADSGTSSNLFSSRTCYDRTFIHEIGHHLGSTHDRGNDVSVAPDGSTRRANPIFPYSYGHNNYNNACFVSISNLSNIVGNNPSQTCNTFGTIMSYDGRRHDIYKFSNPDITCDSTSSPCGVAGVGADAADNARGFNQIRFDVANFFSILPPSPPSITASDGTYDDKVQISWRSVSNADSYKIYRSANASSGYSQIAINSHSPYDDTSAKASTTYYYKVKSCTATNGQGVCSDYSSPDSGYRQSAPGTVLISTSNGIYNNKISLRWDGVANTDFYQIFRSQNATNSYKQIATTTAFFYDDKTTEAGKKYYYKIKSCRQINNICSRFSRSNFGYRNVTFPDLYFSQNPIVTNSTSTINLVLSVSVDTTKNITIDTALSGVELAGSTTNITGNIINNFAIDYVDRVVLFSKKVPLIPAGTLTANIPIIGIGTNSIVGVNINMTGLLLATELSEFSGTSTNIFITNIEANENQQQALLPPRIFLPQRATNMANTLTNYLPLPIIPINIGGEVHLWSISPALVGLLIFNTNDGGFYGEISTGGNAREYTITAVNPAGSDTIILYISP